MRSLDYWSIDVVNDNGVFFVNEEQARLVMNDLEAGVKEWVRFTDLTGSPCMYRAGLIAGVWESTQAQREVGRVHQKELAEERGEVPGLE